MSPFAQQVPDGRSQVAGGPEPLSDLSVRRFRRDGDGLSGQRAGHPELDPLELGPQETLGEIDDLGDLRGGQMTEEFDEDRAHLETFGRRLEALVAGRQVSEPQPWS